MEYNKNNYTHCRPQRRSTPQEIASTEDVLIRPCKNQSQLSTRHGLDQMEGEIISLEPQVKKGPLFSHS